MGVVSFEKVNIIFSPFNNGVCDESFNPADEDDNVGRNGTVSNNC